MNTKLYVENLASATTESNLLDLFSAYGNVVGVSLLKDGADERPSGFGFVTMVTPEGARAALQALNGKAVGTCKLTVSETWPHKEQAGLSSGGRRPHRRSSYLF